MVRIYIFIKKTESHIIMVTLRLCMYVFPDVDEYQNVLLLFRIRLKIRARVKIIKNSPAV